MSALAMLIGFGIQGSANESEPVVQRAMNSVAERVAEFLDDENMQKSIAVGQLQGIPLNLKSSGGVELRRALIHAMEAQGVEVDDDARTSMFGKFKLVEEKEHFDDDFLTLGIQVDLEFFDENGSEIQVEEFKIWGRQVLQIAGLNVDVPSDVSPEKQEREIIRQRKNPTTKVDADGVVRNENPFGVQILVNDGGRISSRAAKLDSRKRPVVELFSSEEYVVRLHNDADFEVAASLVIDGVNVFEMAEDGSVESNSRFIIQPGKHIDIPGWFINTKQTRAFEISGYEGSVAEAEGIAASSLNVGTISAAFQASWEVGGERPDDEPRGNPMGGAATKLGREIEKEYQPVVRDFGKIRSTISVRYDR